MSPHRRPLLNMVQTLAIMAADYRRVFDYEGKAAATMSANVCQCDAHEYAHQRSLGRCIRPRIISSEVAACRRLPSGE